MPDSASAGGDGAGAAPEGITRRDFVGNTLLGSGAALLAMPAPAAARSAAAGASRNASRTVAAALTGLGPEWTGPGGVGDYAGCNGNTAAVVNAAHDAIRNHAADAQLARAVPIDALYDVVIVGAGISGLCAASVIHAARPGARVLVLDQNGIFGGEAKANEFDVDGYRLSAPQGSTGIVIPFARAREANFYSHWAGDLGFADKDFVYQEAKNLASPLQIPTDAYTPMHVGWETADIAHYYEGHGMVKNPWRDGFAHAPMSDRARKAFVDLELFRTPPRRADWERWLDSMTYRQFLLDHCAVPAECIDEICAYLDPVMAAMGCALGADVVSAYAAYNFMMPGVNGYYRYQNGGADPTDTLMLATFPGGNAIIARKFVKRVIPDAIAGSASHYDVLTGTVNPAAFDRADNAVRLRHNATVIAVAHDGAPATAKTASITYLSAGRLYRVRAKAVICAGMQHSNRNICRDISPAVRAAMNQYHHAPMLVLNIAVRNWRFLEKLGVAAVRWFEGFGWWTSLRRNLVVDGHETQPLDPGKPFVLTQYITFGLPGVPLPLQATQARLQLFSMSFAEIEAQARAQFTKMFAPYGFDWDKDVAGIIANRQGHAYFVSPPGFQFGKDGQPPPGAVLQQGFHRILFSHSEVSGVQMWEAAAEQGERAAKQALALI